MDVFAGMDPALPLSEVGGYARRVEAMGYDGLHVAETVHDAFMVSLLALEHTSRITVRTSVAVAFPRSPMVVALASWDLQRFSGGRFSLGLGTQVRGNLEGRYGVPWTEPVPRMREYVESLRAIWHAFQTGDALLYEGEQYRFTRLQPFFNPGPVDHPDIPVYLGGIGKGLVSLAGQIADGLVSHPTNSHPRYLETVLPLLGGKHLIASAQITAAPDAAALAERREQRRARLAFLYSTPAYHRTLELLGHADLGPRLHALSREQRWDDLTAHLDDALFDELVPAAPYEGIAEILAGRYGGIAGGLVLTPPGDPAEDHLMIPVIEALQSGTT